MKFYLYYDFGGCYDGSHTNGLNEYDTLQEALAERDRLLKEYPGDASPDCFTIIEGTEVKAC